jgi:hypothetical protein
MEVAGTNQISEPSWEYALVMVVTLCTGLVFLSSPINFFIHVCVIANISVTFSMNMHFFT